MNIDLTPILQAIIALIATIITVKVIPWIKAKTTNEQQIMIAAVVKTLVFAAEQLYGAGSGEEKLNYVIRELEKQGYTADRNMVEAAVRENFETLCLVKIKEDTESE